MKEVLKFNVLSAQWTFKLVSTMGVLAMGLCLYCFRIYLSNLKHNEIPNFYQFYERQVVECVDSLVVHNRAKNILLGNSTALEILEPVQTSQLHIAFIGDSRIRQLFMDFLLNLPRHDFEMIPQKKYKHADRRIKSEILNLLVSFLWRPNILGKTGDNLTETIRQWILTPQMKPDFVLLGMTLHDMLSERGADHELYKNKLMELYKLLEELNETSTVIWLSVFPTFDTVDDFSWKSTELHTEKIFSYANIAREIFIGGDIRYWELLTPVALEYIRACNMNLRDDSDLYNWANKHINPYMGCQDFVHLGSVVMSEATQMFFKNACSGM